MSINSFINIKNKLPTSNKYTLKQIVAKILLIITNNFFSPLALASDIETKPSLQNNKPLQVTQQILNDNSIEERNHKLDKWENLLSKIKNLMLDQRKVQKPKVFISYAWEDTFTEEGRIENSKLQRYLEKLRDDLQMAGISVFLDIGDMHGNMKKRMEENLKNSDIIITINTPRFKERALAIPQTNLGFEYELTLKKAEEIPYGIFPLHYKGSFNDAFGNWNETLELKELKGFLIRDCRSSESYQSTLVAMQRPLGIIPAIYNIDCDEDNEYSSLIHEWRQSEFNSLPVLNHEHIYRNELLTKISLGLQNNNLQVIGGINGIGKSKLAISYAHQNKNKYNAIRFINAKRNNLRLEFEQMAELFGIDHRGMNATELSSVVYKKIDNHKWLMIFDNAESYDNIKNYLPIYLGENQHVIVTSLNQHWHNCLIVNPFSDDETVKYLNRVLPDVTRDEIFRLAKIVGFVPLALNQASSYIKKSSIKIDTYIKMYNKNDTDFSKLLSLSSQQEYPITALHAIEINLKELKRKSKSAYELLVAGSYLNNDSIPLKLFRDHKSMKSLDAVYNAVIYLKSFSLVESGKNSNTININKLTQKIVRNEYERSNKNKEVILLLSELSKTLASACPWNKITDKDFDKARLLLPHMLELLRKVQSYTSEENLKKEFFTESLLLLNIAKIYEDIGKYEEAEAMLTKALEIKENYCDKDSLEVAIVATSLGNVLKNSGNYAKAKDLYEKALNININHFSENNPETAKSLENIGNIFYNLNDYVQAKNFYENALDIKLKCYPLHHFESAITIENLANILLSENKIDEAIAQYQKTLMIKQENFSPNHPLVAITLANLGNAYYVKKDYKQAKITLEKAVEIYKKHFGSDHQEVAAIWNRLSDIDFASGNTKLALSEAKEAYKIMSNKNSALIANYALKIESIEKILAREESKGLWQKYILPFFKNLALSIHLCKFDLRHLDSPIKFDHKMSHSQIPVLDRQCPFSRNIADCQV